MAIYAEDNWCSCIATTIWKDNSAPRAGTTHNIDPKTNGATCCTAGVRSTHTGFRVVPKINPLPLGTIQTQSTIYLEYKLSEKIIQKCFGTNWYYHPTFHVCFHNFSLQSHEILFSSHMTIQYNTTVIKIQKVKCEKTSCQFRIEGQ